MQAFTGYTSAWLAGLERSASATIGMMRMQPIAIKCPEKPEDLLPYIIEQTVFKMSGGAIGRGYKGILVTEDILKLEQFNVWKETMIAGGIMHPDDIQLKLL